MRGHASNRPDHGTPDNHTQRRANLLLNVVEFLSVWMSTGQASRSVA
jgi:hypothetical protein